MKLLNLGCGNRFHKEWINVDFHSSDSNVIEYNLRTGIPFENETFDVVYHSHVIEHFSKEEGPIFIRECYRVLRPQGILRIAFPDLEQIALNYIRLLNELKNNNLEYINDYDWIMLELFDQTIRNFSGGEMAEYFFRESIPNKGFIIKRIGVEGNKLIEFGSNHYKDKMKEKRKEKISVLKRFNREYFIQKLLGNEYKALQIGRFRLGGEIHQWMYDSYSLSQLLNSIGFRDITERDAFSSFILNWGKYNLDTEPDGSIYKPDSGYIEAKK